MLLIGSYTLKKRSYHNVSSRVVSIKKGRIIFLVIRSYPFKRKDGSYHNVIDRVMSIKKEGRIIMLVIGKENRVVSTKN